MRVVYVIPAWPPVPSQPFVVNEMVEVQAAGHTVIVLPLYRATAAPMQHGTYERLQPEAVLLPALLSVRVLGYALATCIRHPWRVMRTLLAVHWAAGANPYAHFRILAVAPKALAAAWVVRGLAVDRLHAHFASNTAECAAITASVAGLPYSFTAHAYDIYLRTPRFRNDTLRWKVRRAAPVVGVSDYAARLLREGLPPAAHGKVHTVHVGIPMGLFRFEPPAPADPPVRLLCVARYCHKKGIDTLIDACARLRDQGVRVALRVFGDGPLRATLEAQIAAHRLAEVVLLGGPISQEQVAVEMRACHAFVMACRQEASGDMDGIPTVFMEAMATGRPVISCALSGIPELVRHDETGLLVPSDDPAALAQAIARLAADADLRQRLGVNGRALVEQEHDQRTNARRLIALWGHDGRP